MKYFQVYYKGKKLGKLKNERQKAAIEKWFDNLTWEEFGL